MTAGRSLSAAELNSGAAAIAQAMFSTMDNVTKMKAVLDGYSSAQLVSTFGFVQADADMLKSAFTDMADMVLQWQGSAPDGGAHPRDHRVFAKNLLGNGLY